MHWCTKQCCRLHKINNTSLHRSAFSSQSPSNNNNNIYYANMRLGCANIVLMMLPLLLLLMLIKYDWTHSVNTDTAICMLHGVYKYTMGCVPSDAKIGFILSYKSSLWHIIGNSIRNTCETLSCTHTKNAVLSVLTLFIFAHSVDFNVFQWKALSLARKKEHGMRSVCVWVRIMCIHLRTN